MMTEWLRLASQPRVARRALKYAIGVGALLITINHGDALMHGDLSVGRLLRMLLTICVPYVVSTASSVSALRERAASDSRAPGATAPTSRT
jgi:hypothetical protein